MKINKIIIKQEMIDRQLHKLEQQIDLYEQESKDRDVSNMSGAMEVLKTQFRKSASREAVLKQEVEQLQSELNDKNDRILSMTIQLQSQREEIFALSQNRTRYTLAKQRSSSTGSGQLLSRKTSALKTKQHSYTKPGATRILRFGFEVNQDIGGAIITSVESHGYAAAVGLLVHDVIFDFDNKAVTSPEELQRIAKITRSKKIHIGIIRKQKQSTHRNMVWKVIDTANQYPKTLEDESNNEPQRVDSNQKFIRTDANSRLPHHVDPNIINHSHNTPPSSPDSVPAVKSTPKRKPNIPKLHLPVHSMNISALTYNHVQSKYLNRRSSKARK